MQSIKSAIAAALGAVLLIGLCVHSIHAVAQPQNTPVAQAPATQPPDAQAVAALNTQIAEILEASAIVGAGIVVVENRSVVLEHYHGFSDRDAGQRVTAQTPFRAGSISKNVTSLLAVRLEAQGAINLEAPLEEYLPNIALDNPYADTDPVRFEHLLEHTAGLAGSTYWEYTLDAENASPADYVSAISPINLRWRPGVFYSYANAGHTIAAAAMVAKTGVDFDTLAQREIFAPLGMTSANFATAGAGTEGLSISYDVSGVAQQPWRMLIRPSGALIATPRDLTRLVEFYLARGATPGGVQLVPASLIDRMERGETSSAAEQGVQAGSYGLGKFGFAVNGRIVRGHWGATEGFLANMGYMSELGGGFVIMSNTDDGAALSALREAIVAYLARDAAPQPVAPDGGAIDPRVEGAYINYTHDMPMRRWLFEVLEQQRIRIVDGGLEVSARGPFGSSITRYLPAAEGGFRSESLPVATAAFVEEGGELFWSEGEAFRKVPVWLADGLTWLLVGGLAASALAILHGIVWGIMALLKRGPSGAGLWVRAGLAVGGIGFVGASALFVSYGLLGDSNQVDQMGRISLVSVSMAALSVLAAAGAGVALVSTIVKTTRSPSLFLAYAWPASLLLAGMASWWAWRGWVPVMTWVQ
jgi:CubicO group peptidase (beta-lactamase class C family)